MREREREIDLIFSCFAKQNCMTFRFNRRRKEENEGRENSVK